MLGIGDEQEGFALYAKSGINFFGKSVDLQESYDLNGIVPKAVNKLLKRTLNSWLVYVLRNLTNYFTPLLSR